jgi:hypothetical protein
MFSHTAAASLLAATACGDVVSVSNDDSGGSRDATIPDAGRADARSAQDVALTDVVLPDARGKDTGAGQDVAVQAMDGGPDVFDDGDTGLGDAGPCDSGPFEIVDANECAEQCVYACLRYECQNRCETVVPLYGGVFIEDAGDQ